MVILCRLSLVFCLLVASGIPARAASCPLQASYDAWQVMEAQQPKLKRAVDSKAWPDVISIAEQALRQDLQPVRGRMFWEYWLARGLIGAGRGAEAVPILTDSDRYLGGRNEESDRLFFGVMMQKLAVNYLARFTDPAQALRHLEGLRPYMQQEACGEILGLTELYRHAGEIYFYRLDDPVMAGDYFHRAYRHWEQQAPDSSVLPPLLYDLAIVRNSSNEHEIALEYIRSAIKIASRYPRKYDQDFKVGCLNIEAIIYMGWHRYDRAAATLETVVSLRKASSDPYRFDHLTGEYWNLTEAYIELGRYRDAERALKEILRISGHSREQSGDGFMVDYYNGLIKINLRQGKVGQARALADSCARVIERSGLEYGYQRCQLDKHRAAIMARTGRTGEAVALLKSVLESTDLMVRSFLASDPLAAVDLHKTCGDYAYSEKDATGEHSGLRLALEQFQAADALLETIRNSNAWRPSSQYIAEHYRELYERQLMVLCELHALAPDHRWLENAFDVMERNKAMLLYEAVAVNRYPYYESLPADTVHRIREMESAINSLNMEIRSGGGAEVKLRLDKVQTGYRALLAGLHQRDPVPQVRTLSEWSNLCRKHRAGWIEYFDGDSLVIVLSFDGREYTLEALQDREQLGLAMDAVIQHVRDYDAGKGYTGFTEAARYLYESLVPPSIRRKRSPGHIILIPDGQLSFLPFEVLLTTGDRAVTGNYRDLPYWVKEKDLSYAMSASLWSQSRVDRRAPMLSVYHTGERDHLAEVAGESAAMGGLWGGPFERIGTKAAFFQRAESARILHFATHADAGLEAGRENRIRLCDRLLDPACVIAGYELMALDLQGAVVILNACETQYGRNLKGEGVYSLSRDFAITGAQTIVSNMWKVEDRAAGELMIAMMSKWKGKNRLSAAMAEAKRQTIKSAGPQGAHPFFWAGSVAIGDATVSGGRSAWMLYPGTAVGVFLFMAILFYRRKKNA